MVAIFLTLACLDHTAILSVRLLCTRITSPSPSYPALSRNSSATFVRNLYPFIDAVAVSDYVHISIVSSHCAMLIVLPLCVLSPHL